MGPVRIGQFVLFATALLLFGNLALSARQSGPTTQPDTRRPGFDGCLQRSIPLTVIPRFQQPLTELKPLEVFINGNQASVVSSMPYGGPTRVLLLIDSSGSMAPLTGTSVWGMTLPTAAFAMDVVPLNAAVAVGRFAERLQISQWQDRDSAREQVLSLKYQSPKGTTALYSAVSEAASMFRRAQFGDSIYLVTDGGENHSAMSLHRLIENLVARGIRVFVFLVVPKEPAKSQEELNAPHDMEDLANQTGGTVFRLPWSKEWLSSGGASVAAKQIRNAVASPYQIDFQLAAPINKAAKLKLEVQADPKLFTVAYPRRLEPCIAALLQ